MDQSWIEFSQVVPNLGLAVQALTKQGEGVIIQPRYIHRFRCSKGL